MSKYKDIEKEYNRKQTLWKLSIKLEKNKWKRFWRWVWYLIAFPWVWLYTNIRDIRTFVIFAIVCVFVSVEVWLPYLIYFISGNAWCLAIGSACWLLWLGPGTPFLLICIFITIFIKSLFNRKESKK